MNRRLCTTAAVAVVLFVSGIGHAQDVSVDQDPAHLFDEGVKLLEEKEWERAEKKLQASWDLRKSFDTAANLGDAELRVGQTREAAEHLAYALQNLPTSAKTSLKKRMEETFAKARQEVGELVIRVNVSGATVRIGQRTVGTSPLTDPVFEDPGRRRIVAELPGKQAAFQDVDVTKGQRLDVNLTVESERDGSRRPPSTTRPSVLPAVGLGALAAIGAGLGIGFVVASNGAASDAKSIASQLRDSKAACDPVTPGFETSCSEFDDAASRQKTFKTASTVAFVGGAIALAGGVAYLIWWSSSKPPDARKEARLLPVITRDLRGIFVQGNLGKAW